MDKANISHQPQPTYQ